MAKAKITVQASADRPDVLDIRDAMQQVLDFFDLLTADEDKDSLVWNLTLATTNSPFHAEAEAVSTAPGVDIRAVAAARINEASEFMGAFGRGEIPRRQIGRRRHNAAQRVWRRNTAGIGKTVVTFDIPKVADVVVTPTIAAVALEASAREEKAEFDYLPATRERTEHGSVEGVLVDVGTDYNQPAVRIIERKSGKEIACRVDQSVIEEIAQAASFRDVWEHRRVRVRGKIAFDQQGNIIRVYARSITPITPRTMTLRDIEDKDFTGGLTITEYIEKLREGALG
jgi:hypothetical protein